jgi:hypothetical protein
MKVIGIKIEDELADKIQRLFYHKMNDFFSENEDGKAYLNDLIRSKQDFEIAERKMGLYNYKNHLNIVCLDIMKNIGIIRK